MLAPLTAWSAPQVIRPRLLKYLAAFCMLDCVCAATLPASPPPCSGSCKDATPAVFAGYGDNGLTCKGALDLASAAPGGFSGGFGFPFKNACTGAVGVWQANDYCQQSCADAGFNYADPPCCISPSPP